MPQKIFISYRRQDSGANALGISQYLEHEFGGKNVFIDVDMRAGTKFPVLLEQRLAECKVMLVLVGPEWLDARDEEGHRRLDNPDDWVRLEIARALKRDIAIIPVRVNGAALPAKAALPEDIRGLLDHQAISVTLTGFRHDMAGLVRDIRSISKPRHPARLGAVAVGAFLGLAIFAFYQGTWLKSVTERAQTPETSAQTPESAKHEDWNSPGEWVLYAVSAARNQRFAHYFKQTSVRTIGDKVIFAERFPLEEFDAAASDKRRGAYEEDIDVIDCKKSLWVMAESTIYNRSGEPLSQFKNGDPAIINVSDAIQPGAVPSAAEYLMCDEKLRAPLLTKEQLDGNNLSYLTNTVNFDGDIFYGLTPPSADPAGQKGQLFVIKFHQARGFGEMFGKNVLGLPTINYRILVEYLQTDCAERKINIRETQVFDLDGNLAYLSSLRNPPPVTNYGKGSPVGLFFRVVCGSPGPTIEQVQGAYEGAIKTNYNSGTEAQQKIWITLDQNATTVNVDFRTGNGAQGKGVGTLSGDTIGALTLQSTTPNCPGSYDGSIKFTDGSLTFSFTGKDCGGEMQGQGTAKKTG